jgi:hypothetical protein
MYFASSNSAIGIAGETGASVDIGKGVSVTVGMEGAAAVGSMTGTVVAVDVQDERRKMERIMSEWKVLFRMGCILPLVYKINITHLTQFNPEGMAGL